MRLIVPHSPLPHGHEILECHPSKSGVPQGNVLGSVLYTLYAGDLPIRRNVIVATYADDTAILATHQDPEIASIILQRQLSDIQKWLDRSRIKASERKSVHITFTTRKGNCPTVNPYDRPLPSVNEVKYLGMYLDRRLTWTKHIKTKRKAMDLKLRKMYWLVGRKSQLSLYNKLIIYKVIIKPVWAYGIQLWVVACNSNLDIIQRFQSKTLRLMLDAPRYVTIAAIHRDLEIETVKKEIERYSEHYEERLRTHPNELATNLLNRNLVVRRLKRFKPLDLRDRFK